MILASQSPRRKEILELAGYPCICLPQEIDEDALPDESAKELVLRLAHTKAARAKESLDEPTDDFIVGADTIVWMDELIFGKPEDEEDAVRMLRTLSGKTHHVSTGICLMKGNSDKVVEDVVTTDVSFYELDPREILAYIATGDSLDKAGAYGYQSKGCTLVSKISGDYYNVVGLPIGWLVRAMKDFNKD